MAFESLSFRYIFNLSDFPERWLPLIYLYDPDLPLFPIYYFHVLPEGLAANHRPNDNERAFGYVEQINYGGGNSANITVVLNKDLQNPVNQSFMIPVLTAVRERIGLVNPVTSADLNNVFSPPLSMSNQILIEMWHRVVANHYGDKLPFGKLWDEVLGLTRFVASWNSQSGRKGELIQTHYFAAQFGVKIQSSGNIPQIDFYLLPTIQELTDINNPLTSFPNYSDLINIATQIQVKYCSLVTIDGMNISKFTNPFAPKKFNTESVLKILTNPPIPYDKRQFAEQCFNAFGKGPQRTVIFLMLLDDIRHKRISPATLTSPQCGSIYDTLKSVSSYQSPKVIEIYAQQSFGNTAAMPIDTWIETFMKWPLNVWPTGKIKNKYQYIFSHSQNLGKVERLLWVTGQARKVHSSACNNALWCVKYSSRSTPEEEVSTSGNNKRKAIPRGANPLSCNICTTAIRNCCPAYEKIKNSKVCFNSNSTGDIQFAIVTENQKFKFCKGYSIYNEILDDMSSVDDPGGYAPYPDTHHNGSIITVDEFVKIY